jgi:hypothetical protein
MTEQEKIASFLDETIQSVISSSDAEEEGEFRVNAFTKIACDYLIEAGEIDEATVCYHKARGIQINGYNVSEDENCLDIFVTIFNQQQSPTSVTKTQAEAAFRQAEGGLKKALAGYYFSLEESSEDYDMFQRIYDLRDTLTRARIYLLTDGIVSTDQLPIESEGDISISFHVWDLLRIHRFASSGEKFEPIEIKFEEDFGAAIPCLKLVDRETDYNGYLAVIPGKILAGIYDKYGPRLLERNVRSFLQARGNVNKGIRNTILEEPHRFFAYNNGISATADEIEFTEDAGSVLRIKKVRNLQIVNGGQTTASLYHTAKKDKADLTGIYVQAKLSVIPAEHIDSMVPLISKYANSQNKVSDADFYANDPFHVQLEELSRTIWAPAADGTSRQTRWFYERARGQYLDAKSKEGTPARKRQFEALHPNAQKFTKTDLAKYENTWMQLPHLVSLGAQKNFIHFSIRLKERGRVDVDKIYFEHLVAKAVLFKKAEKIIGSLNYGGYRANIVTYTLAWISHHTSQRIDLDKVWKNQGISPALQEQIRTVSEHVHRAITSPPNGKNITEWCKNKKCWDAVSELEIPVNQNLREELIDVSRSAPQQRDKGIEAPNEKEQQNIAAVSKIPPEAWFRISKWAKETNNLQPWQRSLSFSIGRLLSQRKQPSIKQAEHGNKVLKEVKELGFDFEKE